jgi:alkylated DNA repair protein (DNA oxidative demethylase)
MNLLPEEVRHYPGFLSTEQQLRLISSIRAIVGNAPLYTPYMPKTGKPMSVRMTNCGELGWITDKQQGYRYQEFHPVTKNPWPEIPDQLLDIWQKLANYPDRPQACLINYYNADAKMGMHQDSDEQNFAAPVISISLGDDCLFRIGTSKRGGKTRSLRLQSGDVLILEGASRLAFHGVDKIYPNTSMLLNDSGRINLTLRRVR